MKKHSFILLFFLVALLMPKSPPQLLAQQTDHSVIHYNKDKKTILVLNAYHQHYRWADGVMSGVFSELADRKSYELFIEYMDTKRYSDSLYYEKLKEIYYYKYRNIKIDVILTCDYNALFFMLKYHDELFPDVPVSFCGIADMHSSKLEGKDFYAGIYEPYDMAANLDLIKTIHPGVDQVVVISDATETGKAMMEMMKTAEKDFKGILTIEYLINREPKEIKQFLQARKRNTAVIWAIYLRLPNGRFISSEESINLISSMTSCPIYCVWDVVGQGVVGGKVATPFYQGSEAARIAKRILAGEKVSDIEVSGSPMRYKFDYRSLKKFNISPSIIPEGSIVLYNPVSFWEKNKKIATISLTIIVLLLGIILALAYLYRKSKRIEVEIKQKNKELELSKMKAEESDRLKTAFLANLSHEIRTPMNGILGFTELIKSENLSADRISDYIDIINQNGNRLINLIDDLVYISEIEAGQVTLHQVNINLNKLVNEILAYFKPEAEKKGILLSGETSIEDSVNIYIDRIKLEQVLSNLLSNAIKFTEKGRILLKYYRSDEYIFFNVKDTGRGIAPETLHVIFQPFLQADNSFLKGIEGMGLGLSISKSYVEKMGGVMWVDSEINKGSEFFVKLPFVAGSEEIKAKPKPKLLIDEEVKILIAEDDEVSYLYLKELLKNEYITTAHAKNGEIAVQLFKEQDYDLILMDLKMPHVNGIEATKTIRKLDSKIPIIALTAYASEKDKKLALKAGCSDFLSKPIKKSSLLASISQELERIRL